MRYDPESITTEAITLDADYQGWRIRFQGLLGNARVPMQVDVGIGDVVYPAPVWIDYPVLLDQPAPHLLVYTPENAIAEMYQAMVELDKASSRMKDFHDIWTLAHNLEFDGQGLVTKNNILLADMVEVLRSFLMPPTEALVRKR